MTRDTSCATRPARAYGRRAGGAVLLVLLVVLLASCGLPDEGRTQVVDDASVPYGLLDPGAPAGERSPPGSAVPRRVPVISWLGRDDLLRPTDVGLGCEDPPAAVVEALLYDLGQGPGSAERDRGLSSALPSTARLTLVQVAGGVAEVDLDPVTIADAERLPLAVGQVVLSVASAPGVDAVRLVTSGRPVDIPLPSGALATREVTPADYAALLPDRVVDGDKLDTLGCP